MIDQRRDNQNKGYETRYEWLRPEQLIARQKECSLILFPLSPLEYHGPHMPVGVDAINASRIAHECCRRLKKSVVRPTLTIGTEREREPELLESLGFDQGSYIVGMDFPSRLWNSHYMREEVFAIVLAEELRLLVAQGYDNILIVNGHGAYNHKQVIDRLCAQFTNCTKATVETFFTISKEALTEGWAGHADKLETSLMMHYDPECVDLDTLPDSSVEMKYQEFSIVDAAGFTPQYDRDHIVKTDPRQASAAWGKILFEEIVKELTAKVGEMIPEDGSCAKKPVNFKEMKSQKAKNGSNAKMV